MSAVVSGVKAKLSLRLPGQIGTNKQWSDAYVEALILAAAHAACERIGYQWVTQTISLVNNTHEYALNSNIIAVHAVKYSADGTNYDDHLSPTTLGQLDRFTSKWRQDRGTRPSEYALLSVRATMIFSFSATSDKQFVSAKSTYASSTSKGQGRASAKAAIFSGGIIVPEGLFGLARNTSRTQSFGCENSAGNDQSSL